MARERGLTVPNGEGHAHERAGSLLSLWVVMAGPRHDPLPGLPGTEDDSSAFCQRVFDDIVADHAEKQFVGLAAALAVPPTYVPPEVKRSRCPAFSAMGPGSLLRSRGASRCTPPNARLGVARARRYRRVSSCSRALIRAFGDAPRSTPLCAPGSWPTSC